MNRGINGGRGCGIWCYCFDETYKKVRIRQNHISSIENLTLKYEPVSRDAG